MCVCLNCRIICTLEVDREQFDGRIKWVVNCIAWGRGRGDTMTGAWKVQSEWSRLLGALSKLVRENLNKTPIVGIAIGNSCH